MTNNYRALLARESLQDIVGESLCRHTHDILVHAVGTGTHDTTESTRTKFQVLIESIYEGCLVGNYPTLPVLPYVSPRQRLERAILSPVPHTGQ